MSEQGNAPRRFERTRGPRANASQHETRTRDTLEVHIGELVLHGFQLSNRYRIADALEQELARLLEAHDISASIANGNVLTEIDAGTVRLNSGANAQVIGSKTAQAIHGGMSHMAKRK